MERAIKSKKKIAQNIRLYGKGKIRNLSLCRRKTYLVDIRQYFRLCQTNMEMLQVVCPNYYYYYRREMIVCRQSGGMEKNKKKKKFIFTR